MAQTKKPKVTPFMMRLAGRYSPKQAVKKHKPERVPRAGYIYLLRAPHDATLFKIGKATDPSNRLRTFNVKLPFPVEFDCLLQTTDMSLLEKWIHNEYASKRIEGEWFRLDTADVEAIRALGEA